VPIRLYTIVLATFTVVHASTVRRKVSCSTLVQTKLVLGVQVLSAVNVAVGGLNVPSPSGGTILNSFPLCQVQGSVKYASSGNDTPDPHGANTLTWELYLPAAAN
jgi:feruloyl esterase